MLPLQSCQSLRQRMPVTTKEQSFGAGAVGNDVDVILPLSLYGGKDPSLAQHPKSDRTLGSVYTSSRWLKQPNLPSSHILVDD